MEPGRDRDVELYEGRYWDVSLCTGVGGSGGVGSSVGVDGTDGVGNGGGVSGGCGNSDSVGSIGRLCGSGLSQVVGVLCWWWCWRVLDWCCGLGGGWFCGVGMRSGDYLGSFSLMLVAGNMFVAVGACLFGIVNRCGFLDFLK